MDGLGGSVAGFIGVYFLLHALSKAAFPFDTVASIQSEGVSGSVACALVAGMTAAEACFAIAVVSGAVRPARAAWSCVALMILYSSWLAFRASAAGMDAPCGCGGPVAPTIRGGLTRNAVVAAAALIAGITLMIRDARRPEEDTGDRTSGAPA